MSWTDERVEVLKKLWIEGKTASQIASELGGVTRNAVIGKVHRLGLSGRPSPIKRKPKKEKAVSRVAKKKATVKPISRPVVQDDLPADGGACMLELKESMCKWPIGDPKSDNFRFCGQKSASGLPYCEGHAAVAYQTSSRSRKLNEKELASL